MSISVTEHDFMTNHTPRCFADLVFASEKVEDQLRSYAEGYNWGHVLLHGPYGTGKSSTARLIVEARQRACGIQTPFVAQMQADDIKDNIAVITKSASMLYTICNTDKEPFVILDEVDQLNTPQQNKLRAVLDEMVVGRVIFTTNFPDRIDGALRDRCRVLQLLPPSAAQWLARAQAILAAEQVRMSDAAVLSVLEPYSSVRRWLQELWTLVRRARKLTAAVTSAAATTPSVVPAGSAPRNFVVLNTTDVTP